MAAVGPDTEGALEFLSQRALDAVGANGPLRMLAANLVLFIISLGLDAFTLGATIVLTFIFGGLAAVAVVWLLARAVAGVVM